MSGKREIYTESWFNNNKRASIDYALGWVTNHDGFYVEIGSFEGMSTVYIANKIYPTELLAVDTWAGGEFAPYEQMKYATTPIEANFDNNIAVATKGNVLKYKMDWRKFFMGSPAISFIYVDGPHDYDSVYQSLAVIAPLMVEGGVMCGDDYDDISVKKAVDDFFGERVEDRGPTWVVQF